MSWQADGGIIQANLAAAEQHCRDLEASNREQANSEEATSPEEVQALREELLQARSYTPSIQLLIFHLLYPQILPRLAALAVQECPQQYTGLQCPLRAPSRVVRTKHHLLSSSVQRYTECACCLFCSCCACLLKRLHYRCQTRQAESVRCL